MKGWKKISHASVNQKRAGVAILTPHKIGFKPKTVTRDKESHYIMIKGSIQPKYIRIINICIPNIRAAIYIKQILTELKKNRQQYNNNGELQYPTFNNG